MTEKEPVPEFLKYQYGGLAASLMSDEASSKYTNGALETLAGKKGLDLGEEAEGFIKGTMASENGIKTAVSIYNKIFREKRRKYKLSELVEWYNPLLDGLNDEEKKKITGTLTAYNMTLGDMEKAYKTADYILKDPDKLFDNKKKEEAKKTKEKYENTLDLVQILDSYKFESLRPDAVNATRVKELKGLASKL